MWFARTSPIQMWINWKCNDFPIDFIQIGRLLLCVLIKGGFFFIRLFFTAHYFIFHICNAVLLITFDLIMLCPIAIISIQSIDINSQMNSIRKKQSIADLNMHKFPDFYNTISAVALIEMIRCSSKGSDWTDQLLVGLRFSWSEMISRSKGSEWAGCFIERLDINDKLCL